MKIRFSFLLAILWLTACNQNNKTADTHQANEPSKITFSHDFDVYIIDRNDTLAVFQAESADTPYKRETGLMYRKEMKDNQAMLFIFPDQRIRYFYMKNTLIPLDIIYIDSERQIVSIVRNAKPLDETSLPSEKPARYVLEIKAGLSEKLGVKPGMKVVWNET